MPALYNAHSTSHSQPRYGRYGEVCRDILLCKWCTLLRMEGLLDATKHLKASKLKPRRSCRHSRYLFRPYCYDLEKSLHLSSALVAEPRSGWLFGHANTAPMKPFIGTIIVITCDHIAIADAATGAVFSVIAFTLSVIHLDVRLSFLSITLADCTLFPCIGRARL